MLLYRLKKPQTLKMFLISAVDYNFSFLSNDIVCVDREDVEGVLDCILYKEKNIFEGSDNLKSLLVVTVLLWE